MALGFFAQRGHDSFPCGRPRDTLTARKVAILCCALGDLWHCLSECPVFADLRAQWSLRCGISPQVVETWATIFESLTLGQSTTLLAPCVHTSGFWERCASVPSHRCRVRQEDDCCSMPVGPSCSNSLLSEGFTLLFVHRRVLHI